MLTIIEAKDNNSHYQVAGKLKQEELLTYYVRLGEQYSQAGPLDLLVEVNDFRGYTWAGWWTFFLREHQVLRKARRYAAVANQAWFRNSITVLNLFVPFLKLKAFGPAEIVSARQWLER